jgi:hypothetical protein
MPTVRAGDVILIGKLSTNTNCYGLFTRIRVRKPGHLGVCVKLIHLVFKGTNADHLAIQVE